MHTRLVRIVSRLRIFKVVSVNAHGVNFFTSVLAQIGTEMEKTDEKLSEKVLKGRFF